MVGVWAIVRADDAAMSSSAKKAANSRALTRFMRIITFSCCSLCAAQDFLAERH
jgi:hypothetical protein